MYIIPGVRVTACSERCGRPRFSLLYIPWTIGPPLLYLLVVMLVFGMYVCMCVCMYQVCMYVCTYVCMFECTSLEYVRVTAYNEWLVPPQF